MNPPFPLERPEITGHPHGFCVRYMGGVVDVFPDWEGASQGFRMAHAALALLTDVFRNARTNG